MDRLPNEQEIEEAVASGHHASDILRDIVLAVAEIDCGDVMPGYNHCGDDRCVVCLCRGYEANH